MPISPTALPLPSNRSPPNVSAAHKHTQNHTLPIPNSSDTGGTSVPRIPPLMLPSLDFILDASLIPNLPEPGEKGFARELMGRTKGLSPPSIPILKHHHADAGPITAINIGTKMVQSIDRTGREEIIQRSTSLEGGKRIRPGVGAIGMSMESLGYLAPAQDLPVRASSKVKNGVKGQQKGHVRTWSDSTADDIRNQTLKVPEERLVVPPPRKHSRSASVDVGPSNKESLGTRSTNTNLSTQDLGTTVSRKSEKHIKSDKLVSLIPQSIPVGIKLVDQDDSTVSAILLTLETLIPPSRGQSTQSSRRHLDPMLLLTPLAITLEALVIEREVLKSTFPSTAPRLPNLPSGSSLHLQKGEGELDWKIMKSYINSLGTTIDGLIPLIRDSKDKKAVEDLLKQVRVYVGKLKKVFGEVAALYVDGYGFLKGFWDESGMKGSAGEIGRWGDTFEA